MGRNLNPMVCGPIITLTTDFGVTDFYVAAMKAVLLRYCPRAVLIDVTHQIAPQDLLGASFTLERAVSSFPEKTIHLAVVDPGVGSNRRLLIAEVNGSTIICPDNGLITWTQRRHEELKCSELIWRPQTASRTFHGRDIMAPVAGMIAAGSPREILLGEPIQPVLLDIELAKTTVGKVIHVDHFGNATTNIPGENISTKLGSVDVAGMKIPWKGTYSDVAIGQPLALIGSSDLLEIAVRNGNAAKQLKLKTGDPIQLDQSLL